MNIGNFYKFELSSVLGKEQGIALFLKILKIFAIDNTLEMTFETQNIKALHQLKQVFSNRNISVEVAGIHKGENRPSLLRWCMQHISTRFLPRTNLTLNFFILNKNYAFSAGLLHNDYWPPSLYFSFMEYGERQRLRSLADLPPAEFERALNRLNFAPSFYQDIISIHNDTILKYYQRCLEAIDIALNLNINNANRLVVRPRQSADFKVKTLGFSSFHLIPKQPALAVQWLEKCMLHSHLPIADFQYHFTTNFEKALVFGNRQHTQFDKITYRNAQGIVIPLALIHAFRYFNFADINLTFSATLTLPQFGDNTLVQFSLHLNAEGFEIEVDIHDTNNYQGVVQYIERQTSQSLRQFLAF